MKKLLTLALALVALVVAAGLTFGQYPPPPPPYTQYRAGTAGFASGQDGINITFSSPMPNTNYSVVVQATNTAGYSPTSVCTYFNPLHKRANGFEVQHKRCDNGAGVKLDTNVSLDWIAIAKK